MVSANASAVEFTPVEFHVMFHVKLQYDWSYDMAESFHLGNGREDPGS